jgi:hypothetical protein
MTMPTMSMTMTMAQNFAKGRVILQEPNPCKPKEATYRKNKNKKNLTIIRAVGEIAHLTANNHIY